jgi:hypothetical protein
MNEHHQLFGEHNDNVDSPRLLNAMLPFATGEAPLQVCNMISSPLETKPNRAMLASALTLSLLLRSKRWAVVVSRPRCWSHITIISQNSGRGAAACMLSRTPASSQRLHTPPSFVSTEATLTLQGTMRACVNSQVKSACPPSKVVGLDEEEITDFGLGWGHGLALTASKKVFSWGWGKNGQLARFAPSLSLCARDIIL